MGNRLVYRMYLNERHLVKREILRRRRAQTRVHISGAERVNQRWSMNSMADRPANWKALRILTIVDEFGREYPVLDVVGSPRSKRVLESLERSR